METPESRVRNIIREVRSKFKGVNDLYLVLDEIDSVHDSILAKGEAAPSDQQMYTRMAADFAELTNFARAQLESEKSKLNQTIEQKKSQLSKAKEEYSFEEEKLQVRHLIDEDFNTNRLDQGMRGLKQKFSNLAALEGEVHPVEEHLSELDRQLSHLSTIKVQPLTVAVASPVEEYIHAESGCTREGEYLKLGVKVLNESSFVIIGTRVFLEAPEGLEFSEPTEGVITLGNIEPKGGFQSAIFKLKPKRCVSGKVMGSVIYRDYQNIRHTLEFKPVEIASVCPFIIDAGLDKDEILELIKSGVLATERNAFSFKGKPAAVFEIAQNCVRGTTAIDKKAQTIDGTFLGYAFYVGKTMPNFAFAVEIQVTGRQDSGQLTIYVYSDSTPVLTGFFRDILQDVQQHVKIVEEKLTLAVDKCPSCGASLDLSQKTAEGLVTCKYCRTPVYLPKAA